MRSRAVTPPRRSPAGFTLMELIAGLAIVGMLLLGCWLLLRQLEDAQQRFANEARQGDAAGNGLWTLRTLVRSAEAGADSASRFVGDNRQAEFNTWCEVAGGWLEPCRAILTLIPFGDSTLLEARLSNVGTYDLWRGPGRAAFLYFTPSVPDDTWVSVWGASISVPAAVGVATDQYLMVLTAGGRE